MRPTHCWQTHGRKFYLHRANLEYRKTVVASIAVADAKETADRAFAIEPEDWAHTSMRISRNFFKPKETALAAIPAQQQGRFVPVPSNSTSNTSDPHNQMA